MIDFPGRSPYYVPDKMKDFDDLILAILADGDKPNRPLDMVVFDTADEMTPFIIEGMTSMMRENNMNIPKHGDVTDYGSSQKGGRGWKYVNDRFANYLRRLTRSGYGWGLLTHLKEETYTIQVNGKPQEKTRQVPMLNMGVLRPIESLSLVKFQTFVRQVADVSPGTQKMVGNQMVTLPGKTTMVTEFALTFDDAERGAVGLGGNVPLSGTFKLPKFTGWHDVVETQYNLALLKRAKAPETNV